MLKLGIHLGNELLYCGIENWTPCFYSSLYLSIYLSFKVKGLGSIRGYFGLNILGKLNTFV